MVKIEQQLCPSSKYSIKCPNKMNAEYITIHNTANDASAKSEVSYMLGNNQSTSFHYAVDDTVAIQAIPLDRNAWHAGDGNGKGNRASIGIEICYSKSGGTRFIQAEKNAAMLTAKLLKERGWNIDRVRTHKSWSGKYCPHRTLDMGWQRFLNMVSSYLKTDIKYQAHIQNKGWLPIVSTSENDYAGLTGKALRMEALKITADGINLKYKAHVQNIGWQDFVKSGEISGTVGKALRMEAVVIDCDIPIKYRVHVQNIGWMDWVTNGQIAGTTGKALRLEAIEIKLR